MASSQSLTTPCLRGRAHAPCCRFVRALLVATAAALVVVVVHADGATTTTAAAGGSAAATDDHQRPKIPAIFVFGDSIVDPGNTNNWLTAAKANFPPYGQDFPGGVATGRFSNGLVPGDIFGTCVGVVSYPICCRPCLDFNAPSISIRTYMVYIYLFILYCRRHGT